MSVCTAYFIPLYGVRNHKLMTLEPKCRRASRARLLARKEEGDPGRTVGRRKKVSEGGRKEEGGRETGNGGKGGRKEEDRRSTWFPIALQLFNPPCLCVVAVRLFRSRFEIRKGRVQACYKVLTKLNVL